jgi:probable phosphoglycerate mutase
VTPTDEPVKFTISLSEKVNKPSEPSRDTIDGMTIFYLVRHGETGVRNKINGRTPGVHLNHQGHAQAQKMSERFSRIPIAALYSSPLDRTMDTAQHIAQQINLAIQTVEAVTEIDFGEWTGMTFDDIWKDPRWEHFNSFRSGTRIPGGETMLEVQGRFVNWMEAVRPQHDGKRVIVVSHGDPIRAAILYYAGLHIDMFNRLDISLTSVNAISVDDSHARILTFNNVGELP